MERKDYRSWPGKCMKKEKRPKFGESVSAPRTFVGYTWASFRPAKRSQAGHDLPFYSRELCKINQARQKREPELGSGRISNRRRVHELHDFSGNSDKKEK